MLVFVNIYAAIFYAANGFFTARQNCPERDILLMAVISPLNQLAALTTDIV
ncbi:hypothetical protein Z949_3424 [Sulfitobacter guttiformis KCTC 32187]|uniref:Uncharacterized protein n=1 Tax=Sulfitobacter guttiformis TaxID=74349 RepID=A0A420DR97_9RHOB|nr:hypothetical protein Z949_3424 [Sulfitobacter guttiformis KCTC 32187]RKE96834.1 hypothetical protein C8N30_1407 [Sulfitobacter guttiformis]